MPDGPQERLDDLGSREQRWWERRGATVGLVLTALGVAIALVALLNDLRVFDTAEGPIPTGQPASSVSTTLFDDFSTPNIDPTRWRVSDPDAVVSSPGGALRFDVRAPATAPEATLTAVPGRPVSSMDFAVTLLSVDRPSRGGVYAILVGDDGQRRVAFGPAQTPGQYGFTTESCPTISCDRGKEFLDDGALALNRSYHVTIEATAGATTVDVAGFSRIMLPALGRVKEVRLYASAASGDRFAVAIDDVRFGYSG